MIFHNLANYDSGLFVKNLGKSESEINCVQNDEKNYNSFGKETEVGSYTNKEGKDIRIKNETRFIDSFKSMASSLDGLVKNLVSCESSTHLHLTKKHFQEKNSFTLGKGSLSLRPHDRFFKVQRKSVASKGSVLIQAQ